MQGGSSVLKSSLRHTWATVCNGAQSQLVRIVHGKTVPWHAVLLPADRPGDSHSAETYLWLLWLLFKPASCGGVYHLLLGMSGRPWLPFVSAGTVTVPFHALIPQCSVLSRWRHSHARSRCVMTDSVGATKASTMWSHQRSSRGSFQSLSVTAAANIDGTSRVCKCFAARTLLTQSHRLTATSHGALRMLSKSSLSTVPSAGLMVGAPTALVPQRLPRFPPCLRLRSYSRSWCWDFSGSSDFICSAAKTRPVVLPRGTLFFGLIHGECIFNAISAALYHWTPMWCKTAVRALQ